MNGDLRGFGAAGLAAIAVVVLGSFGGPIVGTAFVLGWAAISQTPWSHLGFRAPRSWLFTIVAGTVVGIALKFLMKAVVMPLLGAPALNLQYAYFADSAAAVPGILLMLVANSLGEEVVFRGYLFERVRAAMGDRRRAGLVALAVSTPVFAIAHLADQGWPGVQQAAIVGLAYGGMFLWRREIWTPMIVHVTFNLTAFAMIWLGLEQPIATMFFK